jgi:hypothetical protein
MNRRRDRTKDRSDRPHSARVADETHNDLEGVVAVDRFRVQQADFTLCHIDGCPAIAIPEDWEVVDLDTGAELPMRLCEEHQLAYLRS